MAHVAGVANALVRAGRWSARERPGAAADRSRCGPARGASRFLISFPFEVNPHRYQGVFLRAARARRRNSAGFLYQRYALNDMSGVLLRDALKVPLVLEFNGSEVWAQRHWGEPL